MAACIRSPKPTPEVEDGRSLAWTCDLVRPSSEDTTHEELRHLLASVATQMQAGHTLTHTSLKTITNPTNHIQSVIYNNMLHYGIWNGSCSKRKQKAFKLSDILIEKLHPRWTANVLTSASRETGVSETSPSILGCRQAPVEEPGRVWVSWTKATLRSCPNRR